MFILKAWDLAVLAGLLENSNIHYLTNHTTSGKKAALLPRPDQSLLGVRRKALFCLDSSSLLLEQQHAPEVWIVCSRSWSSALPQQNGFLKFTATATGRDEVHLHLLRSQNRAGHLQRIIALTQCQRPQHILSLALDSQIKAWNPFPNPGLSSRSSSSIKAKNVAK